MSGALVPLGAGLAVVGTLTGLLWKSPGAGRLDASIAACVNRADLGGTIDRGFAILRIAGTTLFYLGALLAVVIAHPAWAFGLTASAAALEAISRVLKWVVRRPRPYEAIPDVRLRLTRPPVDRSFPSADAARAAFLGVLTAALGAPAWSVAAAALAAAAVAFGRVRSGAHYPLDVWAGVLLGLGVALAWMGTL